MADKTVRVYDKLHDEYIDLRVRDNGDGSYSQTTEVGSGFNKLLDSIASYTSTGKIVYTNASGDLVELTPKTAPIVGYPGASVEQVAAVPGKKIRVLDFLLVPNEIVSDGIGIKTDGANNQISVGSLGSLGADLAGGFYSKIRMKTTATAVGAFGFFHTNVGSKVVINFNTPTAGKIQLRIGDVAGNSIIAATTSATNFNDGNYHTIELACNVTARTITITIDGGSQAVSYSSQQTLGTLANFDNNFYLGGSFFDGSVNNRFACTLDSFRIGLSSTNIYASYKMNENTGTAIADETGNGNTGTLGGSPLPSWVSIFIPEKKVTFQSAVALTDLTGNLYSAQANPVAKGFNPNGHFESVAGEALNLKVAGDTAYGGVLSYVEIP